MSYRLLPRALGSLLSVFLVARGLGGLVAAVEGEAELEALDLVINPGRGLLLGALEGLLDLAGSDLPAVERFSAALLVLVLLLVNAGDVVVGLVAAQGLLRAELLLEVGRGGAFVDHLLILLLSAAGQTNLTAVHRRGRYLDY